MTVSEQPIINPKRKNSTKILIFLIVILISIIIGGLIYFQYLLFKTKAEGIAIGYARAASSAYQMGRQIPDTIFEVENYRVEIISTQPVGRLPFGVTVNVKDRYTNITHFSYNQNVTGQLTAPVLPR